MANVYHQYLCRCVAAANQCPDQYITAGIINGRLGFNDYQTPDDAPVGGCDTSPMSATACFGSAGSGVLVNGYDGYSASDSSRSVKSKAVPASELPWRWSFVYYQLTLDRPYSDIR